MLGCKLGLERALHNGGYLAVAAATYTHAVCVVILLGGERECQFASDERWFRRDFGRNFRGNGWWVGGNIKIAR